MPVQRAIKGKIKMIERHRTCAGKVFPEGSIVDYYGIIEKKENCNCGFKARTNRFYHVKGAMIPVTKAEAL